MRFDSKIGAWAFVAVWGISMSQTGCAASSSEPASFTPTISSVPLPATREPTEGSLSSRTMTLADEVDRAIARFRRTR